jgi:tetratricopeptide (TPR) repeat protein
MSRKQITPKENAAQPARQILEKSSYVEAVTWIAARLADGLSHAHQRGIVHRDIKPSNILIAADGQPMLLDFNLARDLKTNDASAVAYVGGTLPYMAPEHLDAFNTQNATPASAVDQRSDIYSLGILLFEMLTNERPFPVEKARSPLPVALERMAAQRRAGVPSPRELNSAVPHSLNAIVRRCLEPEPADRYQEAVSLAEDLQCELDSLPLKHTPEPSWRERVRKWMHRHPRLSSGGSIATIGILLIAVLLYLVLAIGGRLAAYDAERRWIKFQEGLIRAQLLVHTGTEPGENLEEGQRVCTQTLELFNILSDPNWFGSSRFRYLEPRVRQRLADDAVELAILLARTRAEEAKQGRTAHEQTTLISEAVELLTLAEGFTTQAVPRALFEDRSNYRLQLGDHSGAARDQERADATQVRTARDHYLRGAALAIDRQYQVAVNELKAALRADPKHFWARFQLAICYYHMGKYFDAADAYSVCEALWLECAWTNLNRGLAYSRVNMIEEAIEDYTTAIRKDPGFADAHLNRGLAYLQQQKYRECIADESLAIELGTRSSSAARSARATAYAAIGDFDAARKDYEAALNASPGDASVRRSRGFALARHDPQLALADFDALIREEPTSPHAYYGRSYVLGNMTGRIADAIDSARQAIQFDDNHVGARCALAVLLARTGAHEEATSEIERALNQNDAPAVQYAAACVYSLTACDDRTHVDRAIALLESALKGNYGHKIFSSDPDLADLRGLPKFDVLTARFGVTGQ